MKRWFFVFPDNESCEACLEASGFLSRPEGEAHHSHAADDGVARGTWVSVDDEQDGAVSSARTIRALEMRQHATARAHMAYSSPLRYLEENTPTCPLCMQPTAIVSGTSTPFQFRCFTEGCVQCGLVVKCWCDACRKEGGSNV